MAVREMPPFCNGRMLDAVKRYATRVLVIHLALLILVISVVLGARGRCRYRHRKRSRTRSRERLQLLADQTASGFESHYRSILSVLDVVLHDDARAGGDGRRGRRRCLRMCRCRRRCGRRVNAGRAVWFWRGRHGADFGGGRGGGGRVLAESAEPERTGECDAADAESAGAAT